MKFKSSSRVLLCLTLPTLLAGCETFGPSMRDKLPLEPIAQIKDEDRKGHETQFTNLDLGEAGKKKEPPVVEMYPGTGSFVGGSGSQREAGGAQGGKYTLNFDDADLGEVAKVILSDTLGENYVMAPSVSGRVTLQTSRPLTREELIPTLEMLLRMNNVVLIKSAGGYRIEPAANALGGANSAQVGGGQNMPDGFQVRVVPLRYISVTEMQKVLEPLLPQNAVVHADAARNLMVIAGTGAELANILETIDIFDINLLQGMSVMIYPLKNIDPETVVDELKEILATEEEEHPLSGLFKIIPIERLNSVLVITPQPAYLREARVWLDRLDRIVDESGVSGGGVYVYRVQNIEAADLADILNQIFSDKKSKDKTPDAQLAPGSEAVEISADFGSDQTSIGGSEGSSIGTKKRSKKKKSGSGASFSLGDGQDVRIIPDETNNSMVIVASARAYEILKKVILQLDVPPLEVLIDATIVEVRLLDDLEYGVQWYFNHSLGPYGATAVLSRGAITTNPLSSNARPPSGFSYSILDNASTIRAILTALASENKVNVVASPSLMVLNNQEAKINVGDQVPIQTGASTNLNSGGGAVQPNTFATIQMIPTGVILEIKPRVNAGGMVIMEVKQKVSQAVETTTSEINSPTIQTREIESTIAVESGNTLVLGGLIQDQRTQNNSGIPFLRDIPYVGWLFSNTSKNLTRTELVVLITPRVVQERSEVDLITREFKRKLTGLYEEDSASSTETGDREPGR